MSQLNLEPTDQDEIKMLNFIEKKFDHFMWVEQNDGSNCVYDELGLDWAFFILRKSPSTIWFETLWCVLFVAERSIINRKITIYGCEMCFGLGVKQFRANMIAGKCENA